jgi:ATP-dependent Lhr-like helicase
VHVLAATDPANPYGAALPWPRRGEGDKRPFQRAAGASVVLVDGVPALYVERGGHSLQTFPVLDDPTTARLAIDALRTRLSGEGRERELVVARVDGEPVGRSAWYETLVRGGFIQGYRGLVLRRSPGSAMIA